MSDADRTSVAENLHNFLSRVAKGKPEWPLYRVLREVLEADDDEKFYEGLRFVQGNLNELRHEVESSRAIGSSKKMYLRNLDAWGALLSAKSLHTQLKQHSATLDDQSLNHLLGLNDMLSLSHPRQHLTPETVSKLKNRLERISKYVEKSDLEPELKAFVLAQFSNLIWALKNFHSFGVDRVYEAFTVAVAQGQAVWGRQTDVTAHPGFRKAQKVIASFWGVFDRAVRFKQGWPVLEGLWGTLTGDAPTAISFVEEPQELAPPTIFGLLPPKGS